MPAKTQRVQLKRPTLSIIGTYGPSMCTVTQNHRGPYKVKTSILPDLIDNGMGVVRINFSHVKPEQYPEIKCFIDHVRDVERTKAIPIPIIMDLQGPEIRIDKILIRAGYRRKLTATEAKVPVNKGQKLLLVQVKRQRAQRAGGKRTVEPRLANDTLACIEVRFEGNFYDAVSERDLVVVGDNVLYLHAKVKDSRSQSILCIAQNQANISLNQSLNVPGREAIPIRIPVQADMDALNSGFDIDLIAQSFVQDAGDIERLIGFLEDTPLKGKHIIAKIETPAAYRKIKEILKPEQVFGVMVARGDLGVLVDCAEIPRLQRELINCANKLGKPVIVATQMLVSMMERPRPSRSDVQDIATAVWEGADALMLSEETATGKNPVDCVNVMSEVVREYTPVDQKEYLRKFDHKYALPVVARPIDTIGYAICEVAREADSPMIFSYATTGVSATRISRMRPKVPIVAITTSQETARELVLLYNVYPMLVRRKTLPRQPKGFVRFIHTIIWKPKHKDLWDEIRKKERDLQKRPDEGRSFFIVGTQQLSEVTSPVATRGIFVFEPPWSPGRAGVT